ncbi:MAG: hypothetical protein ACK41W_16910, partial [Cyanobacteriota bacterium]
LPADRARQHPRSPGRKPRRALMLVIDASVLVDALLVAGPARERLASENLQAPELIDAELLSVLRRLVLAGQLPEGHALQALATANQLGLRPGSIRSHP